MIHLGRGEFHRIASAQRLGAECAFLGNVLRLFDERCPDYNWLMDQGGDPAFGGLHERVAPGLERAFDVEASMCLSLLRAAENAIELGAAAFVT